MRLRIALAVFTLLFSLVVTQTTYTDWVIIDDFVTGNLNFCSFSSFNLADHLPKTCAATYDTVPDGSGGIIVGNQRDDQITISSGPSGTLVFTTIVIQGNFSCGTPAQSAGYAELQYDGIDNSMNLDVNGLGVQDFTAGGNAVQFHTIVASDTQTVMHVRVYSGGVIGGGLGDYCSYNFTIPGGNLFKEYLVDFGDFVPFGIGCDWTRVGAVDVTIDMINSADPIIAFLTTYGPVPTVTPTISVTASSSATPSVSISITSTRTPSITETPTISETPSISITPTQTVSPTASVSETPTPSISVSPSTSPTPSVSESASVSITPTPTISESETPTPTVSVTVTPTVTVSMSETPTRTVTVSVTKTVSVTVSESRTKSETPTQTTTRTRSVTASLSESPTRTASPTITVTPSITPTVTISVSTSRTPTITSSISKTGSWTRTRTTSISRSLIITPTPSATKTITASISKTGSPSRTAGASRSATRSPSHSRTPTVGAEVPIYSAVCPGTGKMTIDQAFDEAWHTSVASTGGCAHLATYKNEQEFKTLKAAMEEAGVDQAIIGARRQSDSSYQWGAGTIRGKNFVEPALSIAGRADCLQEFCLPNMNYVEPITSDDQVGMVLMLDYANNNVSHLIPSNGAECYVISYETFSYIPNVEGGAPYVLYPALADFDSHQNTAILNRQYLARVSSAQQNQWIQDELQCGTYNLWLGYETVTYPAATRALRLSAGSGDGTEILAAGSTTCKPGVYCNFAPAWLGVGGTDYAVSFASTTGLWSAIAQTTPQGAIRGRDICDAGVGYVDICVPSVYDTWHQTLTTTEALRLIASGSAFYAGGPYQKNIGGVNYIFYFDCMCNTYSHINLSCLAEDDPTSCQLYF